MFIDFENLPKLTESDEIDPITNDKNVQHVSDYDEYSIFNLMNITTLIDRLDQGIDDGNLLPAKFECGDGAQFVNRVFGGDFTSISEFPWYAFYIGISIAKSTVEYFKRLNFFFDSI